MNRRTVLAGAGAAGLAGLSGCLGLIGMDEHESSPAGVEADTRSATGYDQIGIEEVVVEREVGPLSEEISVTNYKTTHEKAVDMGPLGRQRGAVFIVLTTPQVSLLGREFNPVEEMSATELMELVASNYDGLGDVSPDEEFSVSILEEETTRSRFTGEAQFDGADVDVDVHVSEAVEAGEDLLVSIGVYPRRLRGQEEDRIVSLMESVTTDVDEDASSGDSGSDGDGGNESSDDSGSGNETNSSDGNESDGDDGILN
ncbi:DUF6517 family protein [Natrinema sp. LN54]|uniref:DUF6517 family protein n=1 Tax=Natrinema sp. LN54 TaxID=3458705 RepID=UPI004036C3DC